MLKNTTHPLNKKDARIGQKRIMNCGIEAEVIEYRRSDDMDVKFANGVIVEHTYWRHFVKGLIRPVMPVYDHLGNKFGSEREMCEFHGVNKATFQTRKRAGRSLEDALSPEFYPFTNPDNTVPVIYKGKSFPSMKDFAKHYGISYDRLIRLHARYQDNAFDLAIREKDKNREFSVNKNSQRVGETAMQQCGLSCTITQYRNAHDIDVEFEDGVTNEHKAYKEFVKGKIGYPGLSVNTHFKDFHGFSGAYVTAVDGKVLYRCTCNTCGLEDILTPQEMIRHSEVCNGI